MKEQIKTAPPESISSEISGPAGERLGVSPPCRPLPFGVYSGASEPPVPVVSENQTPQT